MNITENLSVFNRRFADEWLHLFPRGVIAEQSGDGALLFRGPVPLSEDPHHIGTHVVVSLDDEVQEALRSAAAAQREEMTQNLICNLGTQVEAMYSMDNIGTNALNIRGDIRIIDGL